MTISSTISILAVAPVANSGTNYSIDAPLAMFLLGVVALGLGYLRHDRSVEQSRQPNNAKGNENHEDHISK